MTKLPAGIEVSTVDIGTSPSGLSTEWIHPSQGDKEKVILYIHGGGFVSGFCADHRAMVAKVVQCSGVGALLFDYRLAPENPYPAALEDTQAVFRWLLTDGIYPGIS
jgi:monoterpene epsilon-lactone hydrolase